jgi:hypothetical protein
VNVARDSGTLLSDLLALEIFYLLSQPHSQVLNMATATTLPPTERPVVS